MSRLPRASAVVPIALPSLALVSLLGLSACGSSSTPSAAPATTAAPAALEEYRCDRAGGPVTTQAGGTLVQATVGEYAIGLDRDTAPAGPVTFAVTNKGAAEHEVVILHRDGLDGLPRDQHGEVDEQAIPADAAVGEIEAIGVGASCALTFTLAPGRYTLFCNITEVANGNVNHAAKGMVTSFTVT